jgi:hypothetical protein
MAIIDQVEGDIAVEAITRARKRNATVVDLADVNAAHKQVVGRDAQLKAWWIGLAGVLLGSAISTAVAVWLANGNGTDAVVLYVLSAVTIIGSGVLFVGTYPR